MNPLAKNFDSEAKQEDCSCIAYVDEMAGTYEVVATHYPLQTEQEGVKKEVLVFESHSRCISFDDKSLNEIQFNNLFEHYTCDHFILYDNYYFEVTKEDNAFWSGARVTGIGSIVNNVLNFKGTVYTSWGEYPIVLYGIKTSNDRRTSSC